MSELARPDESGTTTETSPATSSRSNADWHRRDGSDGRRDPQLTRRSRTDPAGARRSGGGGFSRRTRPQAAGCRRRANAPATVAREDDDTADGGEDWTDAAADRGLTERGPGRRRARGRRHPRPPQRRCSAGRRSPPGSRGRGPAPHRRLPARTAEPCARPGSRRRCRRRWRRRAEEAPPPRRPRARTRVDSGGNGTATAAPASGTATREPTRRARGTAYVDAGVDVSDVDVDGTAILDSLDRRRSTAGGVRAARAVRPAATSWSCTNVTTASRTSACSRAAASSSTTSPLPDRRHDVDRRQHLSRSRAERAAGDGSRVHRHRDAQERRAVPRRRRVRQGRRRRRQRAAAHRARAAQRPVDHRAGHEEPDRAQGRTPHARGEPRRPVRRDGPGPAADVRHLEASPRRRAQATAPGPRSAAAEPTPGSSCAPRPKVRPTKSSSATCCA